MSDHSTTKTFAAFVNVEGKNKFWINQHWQWEEDCPGLFRYETREDKKIVEEVAQSFLDNWDIDKIELVVMEVKSRKEMILTKKIKNDAEEIVEPVKIKKDTIDEPKTPDDILLSSIISDIPAKKRRGRPPKNAIMQL